jgi:hypothetical protein
MTRYLGTILNDGKGKQIDMMIEAEQNHLLMNMGKEGYIHVEIENGELALSVEIPKGSKKRKIELGPLGENNADVLVHPHGRPGGKKGDYAGQG